MLPNIKLQLSALRAAAEFGVIVSGQDMAGSYDQGSGHGKKEKNRRMGRRTLSHCGLPRARARALPFLSMGPRWRLFCAAACRALPQGHPREERESREEGHSRTEASWRCGGGRAVFTRGGLDRSPLVLRQRHRRESRQERHIRFNAMLSNLALHPAACWLRARRCRALAATTAAAECRVGRVSRESTMTPRSAR